MSKKYPFVLQYDWKDCGVACLSMVIQYYKGRVPFSELRELTKTSKTGTTAYHLQEAAKTLGFHAVGYRVDENFFPNQELIFPCIAHVTIDHSYQHYIVIYKIDWQKKYLIIADPATTIKKMSWDEFIEIWNQFLLILYPEKTIPIIGDETLSLGQLWWKFLKHYKKSFILIIILSVLVIIGSILSSTLLQCLVDIFQNDVTLSFLKYMILFYIVIYFFRDLSNFFRNRILIWLNKEFDYFLTEDTYRNLLLLPYQYYCNRTTGELVSRIRDLEVIRGVIGRMVFAIFIDIPLALIVFLILFMISFWLGMGAMILFGVYMVGLFIFQKKLFPNIKDIQQRRGQVTSEMVEVIGAFRSIKGCHLEKLFIERFRKKYRYLVNLIATYEKQYNVQLFLESFVYDTFLILLLCVGSREIVNGHLSLGGLLLFYSFVSYIFHPLKNLVVLHKDWKEASYALKRVTELSYSKRMFGTEKQLLLGEIVFSHVDYSFNDCDLVLNDVDFSILPGEKVMIMGKSGSGKSTLFGMLMKYYPVERGQVMIHGIDINDYTEESIVRSIIYVGNEETLFTETLYYNIMIEKEDVYQFQEVVKICCVEEIIQRESLGYQVMVEENGFNFSSGEKQRIVLARALLRPFEILIIDEGLSHVDCNLERKILKNIFEKYSNRTIIVVSHRGDNIDLFDHLIELQNGKVVRDVRKNGAY